MSGPVIALLLSVASALGYATAAVEQQRLAARLDAPLGWLAALRYPRWWAAALLNIVAAVLHVVALRFGPLTLVQPLGMLTLILALPLGAALARRRVSPIEWRGAAAAAAGLAGLVALTSSAASIRALSTREAVLATVATAVVVAALVMLGMRSSRPAARSLCYAAASGIAFGISSALAQTFTVVFATGDLAANATLTTAIAVLVTTAVLLAQASYRYGLAAPLATSTIANPVAAAVVGMAVLGERLSAGVAGIPLAIAASGLAAYGVVVLTAHIPQVAPAPAGPNRAAARRRDRRARMAVRCHGRVRRARAELRRRRTADPAAVEWTPALLNGDDRAERAATADPRADDLTVPADRRAARR